MTTIREDSTCIYPTVMTASPRRNCWAIGSKQPGGTHPAPMPRSENILLPLAEASSGRWRGPWSGNRRSAFVGRQQRSASAAGRGATAGVVLGGGGSSSSGESVDAARTSAQVLLAARALDLRRRAGGRCGYVPCSGRPNACGGIVMGAGRVGASYGGGRALYTVRRDYLCMFLLSMECTRAGLDCNPLGSPAGWSTRSDVSGAM
jgi:hypothetical protein